MRWIGQHIWDFISRFRNDIYLEATGTGTIASGGNLGLDSNNKIVKAGDALSFDGSTANGVLTYGGAGQIDVESALTFSGTTLGNLSGATGFVAATDLTFFGGTDVRITSGNLAITGASDSAAFITLGEDTDNGTNVAKVIAPTAITSDRTITLPDATGTVALTHFSIPSDGAGNADGEIVYIGSGSTVIGKIYYYKSDGSWGLTNSDDPGTATGWLAVALGDDPDDDGMLVRGMIDLAGDIVGTEALGSIIYLDKATTGDATTAAPTATGDIVRVIGYAVTTGNANKIWFNPDNTWVEHV